MRLTTAAILVLSAIALSARGEIIDAESNPIPPLRDLVDAFDTAGVDVMFSHDSEAGQSGPSYGDRPRIAPLLGLNTGRSVAVDLEQHAQWLDAFESGARGAVAAAPADDDDDTRPSFEAFNRIWNDAERGARIVVTFDGSDLETASKVADVLESNGYAVYLAMADPDEEALDPEMLGALFVEADHVLMIETTSARLNALIQFEADLLAELRRQKDWVADGEEGLPPVKRGSMDVIESLGVLPMQVVPGGVVLGTMPRLQKDMTGATFVYDGSDFGVEVNGRRYILEQVSDETREAIRAFVANESSHSIVDIAGGDVTLTDSFKDTRIGQRMARADRMPFDHLSGDGVHKSLIVDHGVQLRHTDSRLIADVSLEVRLYRRDGEGHADRLSTIRFTIQDATGDKRLMELNWSRPPASSMGFQGSGTSKLVKSLQQCALDAALIAVARLGEPVDDTRDPGEMELAGPPS